MLFDNKQSLRADQLNELRAQNLINDSEFAYIAGDLLVAENVTTSEKRVLGKVKEFSRIYSRKIKDFRKLMNDPGGCDF